MLTSAGHTALTPSQDSIGLHIRLRDARQTMPAEITWSGGQFGEEPKQISGKSHSPTEALHSTPLKYLGRQSGAVPVHWSSASHGPTIVVLQMVPADL